MEIRIDEGFRTLLIPLTENERAGLEESILSEGCRVPLDIWQNTLIDGHNRYEICQKHGIDYLVNEVTLNTRSDVEMWIVKNQLSRRNLTPFQKAELALKAKPMIEERAKEKQRNSGGSVVQKSVEPPIKVQKEIADLAGVSHDTVHRTETVLKKATPEVQQQVRTGEVSLNQAYQTIKKDERRHDRIELAKSLSEASFELNPSLGKYPIIYADPPWRYDFSNTDSRKIENQYPTMSIEEICDLPVSDVSLDDCVLFMWTTSPKLEESFKVLRSWGFNYVTHAIWDKEIIGMGYWFRGQHEMLIVAKKGTPPTPEPSARMSSVFRVKRTEHSQKPDEFYELIERYYPDLPKLELFARDQRDGWKVWGNQAA